MPMAMVLPRRSDPTAGEGSQLAEMERDGLSCALAMLERLIICEMDINMQPKTEYPGLDSVMDFPPVMA
ncbi:hypothetical protein BDV29DRAFT_162330 [Aspergillus leporis]|uniref:Uncharacterized protein n=1 Tax=Aspergillus leporis TaxID=41062 RepID=A0A5N5WIV0_9EURO|nr:hypothetical protein BDV29DRAFT_162330 [Aspergillus leporis]